MFPSTKHNVQHNAVVPKRHTLNNRTIRRPKNKRQLVPSLVKAYIHNEFQSVLKTHSFVCKLAINNLQVKELLGLVHHYGIRYVEEREIASKDR